MKKLILAIFISVFVFIFKNSFCQPFDCTKDDEISTIYLDVNGVTEKHEYGTHWLSPMMDTSMVNDTIYLQSIIDFVHSRNSLIKEIFLDTINRKTAVDFFESKGFNVSIIPFDYSYVGLTDVRLSDTSDAHEEIGVFSNSGLFIYIDYHPVGHAEGYPLEPTDPYWSQHNQWYLKQSRSNTSPNHDIDANKAWWITKGDFTKVRIYILDTGIRLSSNSSSSPIDHQDLSTTYFIKGTNYTSSLSLDDTINHGTGIAGLIGASHNTDGLAGLSPKCNVIIHKIQRGLSDQFIAANWAAAINNAVDYKRSSSGSNIDVVINISLTFNSATGNATVRSALERARDTNIVVCCAAGNDNTLVPYPARLADSLNNVISVGATDRNDNRATYSNFAPSSTGYPKYLTLMSPGGIHVTGTANITVDMITTSRTSYTAYGYAAGTSFAAPLVTSTCAMMLCINSNLKASQVKDRIIRGCENRQNPYSVTYGWGRLNAFNSIDLALDSILGINSNDSNRTFNLTKNYRIASNFSIPRKCTIVVKPGFSLTLDKGVTLHFQSRAKIKLEGQSSSPATFIQRKSSTVSDRGEFLFSGTTYYCVEDSATFNLTGQGPEGPNDYGCVAIWGGNFLLEENTTFTINTDGFMTVKDGGSIFLADNCHLKFGGSSYLELSDYTSLFFGSNSFISFSDNSYLYADSEDTSHIYFSGITDTTKWNGIFFDSSLVNDTLEKCVFSGAKTAITIRNSTTSSNVSRIFEDNIFNVPAGDGNKAIYSENTHKITVEDNEFNMPNTSSSGFINVGIFLKNVSTSSTPVNTDPEGASEDPDNEMVYILNIVGNTFTKGSASIVLANYTSNYLPYFIKDNTFDSSASSLNILGMKIGGTIKDNVVTSMQTPMGVHLINSNPDFYNNTFANRDVALHLVGSCYPNLAPVISENQMAWTGGRNHLSSYQLDAIQLGAPGNVFTDFGLDRFSVTNSTGYHIYGWLDSTINTYYSRNNCWYRPSSTVANIYLIKHPFQQVPVVTYNYYYDCTVEPYPNEWDVDYKGHGISDSIMISDNDVGYFPDEDGQLYVQALDQYGDDQYASSIVTLKSLIDNFQNSDLLEDAVYYLYGSCEQLDTSANQNYVNTLYGNLKIYLEDKIESENYSSEFNDIAYDTKLMCEAKLENYNAASNGYEFLAIFHPDPDIRLTASWNYSEIQEILNSGSGGGLNMNLDMEQLEQREVNKIMELSSSDPIIVNFV